MRNSEVIFEEVIGETAYASRMVVEAHGRAFALLIREGDKIIRIYASGDLAACRSAYKTALSDATRNGRIPSFITKRMTRR